MEKPHAVYLMSNKPEGLLYHGSTGNLVQRRAQNAGELFGGSEFCRKYGLDKLVYFEVCDTKEQALRREWQLKRWRREWKIEMVNKFNPEWKDLGPELLRLLPWALMGC
ncbi:MAG: GIY-YIG nuclease family protein [Proteobacteria bacterium]|nr:GIY-YIG nuclease family protein [Pseudomonadota bacterium]